MATLEKLKVHIDKSKTQLDEAIKKAEDPKKDLGVRKAKKKNKRLARKSAKIIAFNAMAEEKKKPKKERKKAKAD